MYNGYIVEKYRTTYFAKKGQYGQKMSKMKNKLFYRVKSLTCNMEKIKQNN